MSIYSQNMLPIFILFSENRKLKEKVTELKRQNSQIEIEYKEKLDKSNESIDQMKDEIDFLVNINQQFGMENDQLTKDLDRFRKYRIPELSQSTISSISARSSPDDSDTEFENTLKRSKVIKTKPIKIAKTNKRKN